VKKAFLEKHPIQPTLSDSSNKVLLPFNPAIAFYSTGAAGAARVHRKWLSYFEATSSLFCTTCMCFDDRSTSAFVSGFNVKGRHDVYDKIRKHEECVSHREAMSAFTAAMCEKDVGTLLDKGLASLNTQERQRRRSIVERITDICLYVGTQGIAYRGKRGENIASLHDPAVNHGNFLELCLLLSKYDPVLKSHIDQCVEIARKRRESGKTKGRGSLVTFMSKTSINRLITVIGSEIQSHIAQEANMAGMYSIQVDSTQDVSSLDQLAIVIRITTKKGAEEKLLTLVVSHDGTGLGLYDKVVQELVKHGLSPKNIIACSFDGASNMSGIFKGLQARLKQDNPDLVYTHCAGHCLNLVLTGCSESCNAVKSLFGLVQNGAVFISDSYKRSDVWSKIVQERNTGQGKLRRLGKIGKTRWWSKPNALQSVIDRPHEKSSKLVDFMLCMNEIKTSNLFDSSSVQTAESLQTSWCKFEMLLLARVMLDIFDTATPVSKGLQSPQVDYLITFQMIQNLLKKIELMRDNFESYVENTKSYIHQINEQLEEAGCLDVEVNDEFAPLRKARNATCSRRPSVGEVDAEIQQKEAADFFRINTFNVVIDHVTQGLRDRFSPNEGLLKDLALLDPKRFSSAVGVDASAATKDIENELSCISSLAKVSASQAHRELADFRLTYLSLHPSPSSSSSTSTAADRLASGSLVDFDDDAAFSDDDGDPNCDGDDDEELDLKKVKCELCRHCIGCAYKAFTENPMLQVSYPTLFVLYKFALTLPTTQVSCERVFSHLKIIKTRLRAALKQFLLEPLVMMNVHREIALSLDRNELIKKFAGSSTLLSKLLL